MPGCDVLSMTSLARAPSPTGRVQRQWTAVCRSLVALSRFPYCCSANVFHTSFVHLQLEISMVAAHGSAQLEIILATKITLSYLPNLDSSHLENPLCTCSQSSPLCSRLGHCQRIILYLRLAVPLTCATPLILRQCFLPLSPKSAIFYPKRMQEVRSVLSV